MILSDSIYTPRLQLRRITEGDLPQFVAWSHSREAHGEYLTPECIDPERGLENIRNSVYWNPTNRIFFVTKKDTTPLGTIHYWLRTEKKDCAVMAVKISELKWRNQGFGTEAQKYLILWLFERMKMSSVEMYTDINNHPQQSCLKKLGFVQVETLSYDDHHVNRVGYLFRLDRSRFADTPIYRYHYEE